MEQEQRIDVRSTSVNSLLETLRQQGITSLEDLVEKTVGSVDDALSTRDEEAEAFGCCFICSPTGHGYCYVILSETEKPPVQ